MLECPHDLRVQFGMIAELTGILAGIALALLLAFCARCAVRWMP
jgi:hypothetical protein